VSCIQQTAASVWTKSLCQLQIELTRETLVLGEEQQVADLLLRRDPP
jgi:hypothetical protein